MNRVYAILYYTTVLKRKEQNRYLKVSSYNA